MTKEIAVLGIEVRTDSVAQGEKRLDSLALAGGKAEKATDALSRAFVGLAGAMSIGEMSRAVESWQTLNAQLNIATGSMKAGSVAYQEVVKMAVETGQSLESVGMVYARLAQNASQIGISQQKVADTTTAISKAMALSGGSAASAQAALVQFNQALASGTLRGEELNSILEQAPRLTRALADGLGVPIGQLKKLGEEGKLTSDVLVSALGSQSAKLAKEFEQLPLTMSRALQNLKTQWVDTMGSLESSTGAFGAAAKTVDSVAKNMDVLAIASTAVAAVYGGKMVSAIAAATAAKVANAAAITSQARATQAAAIAAQQYTGLMMSQATATAAANATIAASTTAAATATGLARGAMAALGGPIGIVTTALTLGATAWAVWGNKTEEATAKAADSAIQNLDSVIAKIEEMNGRLSQINRNAYDNNLKSAESEAKTVAAQIGMLQSQLDSLDAKGGKGRFSDEGKSKQAELNALAQREIILQAQLGEARAKSAQVGTAALQSFIDKNAVGSDKVRVEQQKLLSEYATAIQNTGGVFDSSNQMHVSAMASLNAGLADAAKGQKTPKTPKGPKENENAGFDVTAAKAYESSISGIIGAQLAAEKSTLSLNGAQTALYDLMRSSEWDRMPEAWQQIAIAETAAATEAINAADQVKRLNDMLAATESAGIEKARSDMELLTKALNAGTISEQTYLEAATARLNLTAEKTKDVTNEMDEFAKSAAKNMQSSFADFLFDPFANGTKSMGENFANSLKRMLAEAASAKIMNALVGDGKSEKGLVGSIDWSKLFSGFGSSSSSGATGLASLQSSGVQASFDVGTDYVPYDMVAKVHKGERITPAKFNPANGGGAVSVQINNYSGQSVQQKEVPDGRGGRRIEVTVGDMVAAEMRRTGSAANKALSQPRMVSR